MTKPLDNKRHAGVTTAPDVLTEGPDRLMVGAITHIAVPFYSGQIEVKVRVIDERKRFGKRDFQVTPMSGRGTVWVQEARLRDPEPSYIVKPGNRRATQEKNAAKMERIASGEEKNTGGWQQQAEQAKIEAEQAERERVTQMTDSMANPKLASRTPRKTR